MLDLSLFGDISLVVAQVLVYVLSFESYKVGVLFYGSKMARIPSLKSLNAFPHAEEHLLKKTYSGAIGTDCGDPILLWLLQVDAAVYGLGVLSLTCDILAVTILGLIIMFTLFVHELQFYLTTYTVHQVWLVTASVFVVDYYQTSVIFV